jgi:hypothetical protein
VTLGYFRHPSSKVLLRRLVESGHPVVQEAAELSVRQLGGV